MVVVAVMVGAVAVEGEDMALNCNRAGGSGAGGVVPVDGSSVSIAFEPICGARGGGGGGGSGGGGGGRNRCWSFVASVVVW